MAESNSPHLHDELFAGYVLGDLSSEELAELEALIAANPALETELWQLQEAATSLPYGLPVAQPAATVRANVLAAAATPFPAIPTPAARRRRLVFSFAAGSAAAIAAIAFGINNWQLRQQLGAAHAAIAQQQLTLDQKTTQLSEQSDLIAMLQQAETHVMPLKGMAQLTQATGAAIVTNAQPVAILILKNLPPLPNGKSYLLWEVADGQKKACGPFQPNPKGQVFVKLPLASPNLTNLVVTVEETPTPDKPKGPMVMSSEI